MISQFVRRFKWAYSLYNLFHKKQLSHTVEKYRQLGLNKFYFSSVSSRDFLKVPEELQKKRLPNCSGVQATKLYSLLDAESKKSLDNFEQNGYAVLNQYLDQHQVDSINAEMHDLLMKGTVQQGNGGKIMFAIHHSQLLREIGKDPELLSLLSELMDGHAVLFQSINFLKGSEQASHSDSIHMTTYPLGGLLGVWIALEDIHPENGPLHYYPGSHKLPYYLNADYNNEGNFFLLGPKDYSAYEQFMQGKIKELDLKKEILCIPKGSLMIWHANLFHGGEIHRDKSKTRKSIVFHYFDDESICYHEITQRPALVRSGLK
ncbi:phytanoyl-CoA dioxygenase family protein [Flavihumibacter sp. UBA7668]|uniref:phytanoyl-CoA dioxygenase family protein n=1 Tax=Flavihumibacter sp. UBA7668 TaxID=1946542 RepID=UPI0025BFEA16|nr:phytanoyl-CoA dioxygenase family protein [Flavihumibacter sp. UBA7668]